MMRRQIPHSFRYRHVFAQEINTVMRRKYRRTGRGRKNYCRGVMSDGKLQYGDEMSGVEWLCCVLEGRGSSRAFKTRYGRLIL